MSVVMQISDTHFGTEQPDVVEALLRMFKEEKPDLVILSGDITQRARRSRTPSTTIAKTGRMIRKSCA